MPPPRILFYDIETTDLDADFGNMLAFGYKWFGQKRPKVLSLLDTAPICKSCKLVDAVSDKNLIKAAHAILSQADMWVTWYGKQFDYKFLNTRIIDANLPPLPPVAHVDLYWTARLKFKLSSNRLASVQDFLRLPTTKTVLNKRVWRRAQAGHVPSIKYIEEHCARDVSVLEEAYMILRPYVRQHPRLDGRGACRVCGGLHLVRHGVRARVSTGPVFRLLCKACGHTEQRPMSKIRG